MVENGEIWLRGVNIPMYDEGSWTNHSPLRARKLLLNRNEISKISNKMKESGLTLIPLSLYFSDGKAKVEIGIAKGRKNYDKRQAIAEKDAKRETAKAVGRRNKGIEN
jgi:SsrA-binding protein